VDYYAVLFTQTKHPIRFRAPKGRVPGEGYSFRFPSSSVSHRLPRVVCTWFLLCSDVGCPVCAVFNAVAFCLDPFCIRFHVFIYSLTACVSLSIVTLAFISYVPVDDAFTVAPPPPPMDGHLIFVIS